MNYTKLFTSLTLSLSLLCFNMSLAMAATYSDINSDYWAYNEIQSLSEQNIISGYPDESFKPDNPVNRAEFTSMVIKALNKEGMPITIVNSFSDISDDFWAYNNILRSNELGLVIGYPDYTFKPENSITKEEATSILSKTLKDSEVQCTNADGTCPVMECPLNKFEDKDQIANWAKMSFAKAVQNGLYVNHPDENYLSPNKKLTRAEAAVLLYKIRQNPRLITAEYKGPELQKMTMVQNTLPEKAKIEEFETIEEHLPENAFSGTMNTVEITGSKAKLLAYNVLPVKFEGGFLSKKQKKDDVVYLVFDKDLTTEEGTKIVPAGSKLVAEITRLKRGKPFHVNAEAALKITNLVTPAGDVYPFSGTIENNELFEPEFGKCNLKRAGIVSGSVATFGTLLGLFIGCGDDIGDGTALGAILGGSIGAGLGLMVPGCGITIPEDQEIYVKLNNDFECNISR